MLDPVPGSCLTFAPLQSPPQKPNPFMLMDIVNFFFHLFRQSCTQVMHKLCRLGLPGCMICHVPIQSTEWINCNQHYPNSNHIHTPNPGPTTSGLVRGCSQTPSWWTSLNMRQKYLNFFHSLELRYQEWAFWKLKSTLTLIPIENP